MATKLLPVEAARSWLIFPIEHRCIITHSSFSKSTVFFCKLSCKGSQLSRIENDTTAFISKLEEGNKVSDFLKLLVGESIDLWLESFTSDRHNHEKDFLAMTLL
ncbi:hypothetical protein AY599_21320 [Leptolyngbya valderiana BDU 20041]|nr:hypothetical protein AY599_21320 [Leptolyngbya valderiana BDU 20041]